MGCKCTEAATARDIGKSIMRPCFIAFVADGLPCGLRKGITMARTGQSGLRSIRRGHRSNHVLEMERREMPCPVWERGRRRTRQDQISRRPRKPEVKLRTLKRSAPCEEKPFLLPDPLPGSASVSQKADPAVDLMSRRHPLRRSNDRTCSASESKPPAVQ